jgi:hypothetical protein
MGFSDSKILAYSNNKAGAVRWDTMIFGIQQAITDIEPETETERVEQIVSS